MCVGYYLTKIYGSVQLQQQSLLTLRRNVQKTLNFWQFVWSPSFATMLLKFSASREPAAVQAAGEAPFMSCDKRPVIW